MDILIWVVIMFLMFCSIFGYNVYLCILYKEYKTPIWGYLSGLIISFYYLVSLMLEF